MSTPVEGPAALMAALAETARLLESGDAPGAAAVMGSLVGRCQSVSAATLDAQTVAAARQLLDRCLQAQIKLKKQVVAAMEGTNAGRRATTAYSR